MRQVMDPSGTILASNFGENVGQNTTEREPALDVTGRHG